MISSKTGIFDHLFEVVILPELVSRKSDVDNSENEKLY